MAGRPDIIDELGLLHRIIAVNGRSVRVRMEPKMWDALAEICQREGQDRDRLFETIDLRRGDAALAAATRVFIISYYRRAGDQSLQGTGEGSEGSPLFRAALEACKASR